MLRHWWVTWRRVTYVRTYECMGLPPSVKYPHDIHQWLSYKYIPPVLPTTCMKEFMDPVLNQAAVWWRHHTGSSTRCTEISLIDTMPLKYSTQYACVVGILLELKRRAKTAYKCHINGHDTVRITKRRTGYRTWGFFTHIVQCQKWSFCRNRDTRQTTRKTWRHERTVTNRHEVLQ